MHVMTDIECLDLRPSAVILSIGFVAFNPETKTVFERGGLVVYPSIDEQLQAGRTICESTLLWWMGQSIEAKADWMKGGRRSVDWCAGQIRGWFENQESPCYLWGNGATFDQPAIESFLDYKALPWKYYNARDTRTLWHLFPYDEALKGETAHTALGDAVAQAHRVCEVWPSKEPGIYRPDDEL